MGGCSLRGRGIDSGCNDVTIAYTGWLDWRMYSSVSDGSGVSRVIVVGH